MSLRATKKLKPTDALYQITSVFATVSALKAK
jgi:hypothetical protein